MNKIIMMLVLIKLTGASAMAGKASNGLVLLDPTGKQIVSPSDVTCLALGKDAAGKHVATLKLNDEAASRLSEMTKNNIGKKMAIVICGKKSNQPTIAGEINGKTVMNFGLTSAQMDCLSKSPNIQPKCED